MFETLGCNDERVVPLSPLDYRPYVRAMLVGLEDQLHGSRRGLPPPMLFRLGPEPEASEHFNDLPDSEVRVPRVDDATQPQGGVRFPEVDLPLGRLDPPALKPATTSGATAICGNFSAYEPFHRGELQSRYGDVERYESRVLSRLDWLVRSGLLLKYDRRGVAQDLRHRFESAPS